MLTIKCKARDLNATLQAALLKLYERPKLPSDAELLEVHWGLWWVCKGGKL